MSLAVRSVPAAFALRMGCLAAVAVSIACYDNELPPTAPARSAPPSASARRSPPSVPLPSKRLEYPPTAKRPVIDLYREVRVVDDYRWLENGADPAVQTWSNEENAFARTWLDAAPSREAIRSRIQSLMADSSPSYRGLTARHGLYFALESRPPKQQPYLVVLRSLGDTKSARVLVDPAVTDPSGATSIRWFVPSVDGKKVAVSLAKDGSESGNVHVFDVATGKAEQDDVPQADDAGDGSCLAWKADGKGFFYTKGRPDGASPSAYRHLQFHKLGDAPDKDKAVLGQNGSRIAQWEVVTGGDGRTILARVEEGDSGEWEHWVNASGTWVRVASRASAVKEVRVAPDGSLFFVSAKNAPRHRLLHAAGASLSLAKAEEVIAEGSAVLEDVLPTASLVYLLENVGGLSRVLRMSLGKKGGSEATTVLPTLPFSDSFGLTSLGGDDVAFASVSYTQPEAYYKVSGKDAGVSKTALAASTSADFSGVEVTRETCTSKDGTVVPLTIIRTASMEDPGHNAPTLLYGYGGYGVSVMPRFRPSMLAWLEQGGIYAVASIRGGGELGEAWHSGGDLTHKQNGFDDFYACAEHLAGRYTTSAHLAIQGGSNGGLLMGAEITQHPTAWKAVVAQVGVFDMLRLERDSNGAFNVTEYGTVNDPSQFDALYAFSPYHHVTDGVPYPAALFMTGASDPRVEPYHSRKMVARLQAATSSDAPILLCTSATTGHGVGTPLDANIEETADVYTFLFTTLGVKYSLR